jgi:hypothetical protein
MGRAFANTLTKHGMEEGGDTFLSRVMVAIHTMQQA